MAIWIVYEIQMLLWQSSQGAIPDGKDEAYC